VTATSVELPGGRVRFGTTDAITDAVTDTTDEPVV
jgi:hypothetical protein